ncbi:MAG: Mrp/NBP35 family ATP-binding protein, partial [Lentisphaeria bacterium]|nr:Mrp/NBP35 family ATP-binding protein [Lentisphaeria bacterium]
ATNLAMSLALSGKKVGLLDVDIHGPSIPTMLGLAKKQSLMQSEDGIEPIVAMENMKVISVSFFLEDPDMPLIWRGPMKIGIIKQFLKDVNWGELDYLIIDSPPGTGDEPLSVVQQIGSIDGGVVVTTPQEVALADVRKNINFAIKLKLPILGVIENMSGFKCPCCDTITEIFQGAGGEHLAKEMDVKFLGKIPIEPEIAKACDSGKPYVSAFADSLTAKCFEEIVDNITTKL